MKIGMVLFDMQELGGLEEYAVTMATTLRQMGHDVSILSTAWVPTGNQYLKRLDKDGIEFWQLPKWVSHPASDWQTKETILNALTWIFSPFILLVGLVFAVVRRSQVQESVRSARNWLRGQMMRRLIGPDWRKPFVRFMLGTWKLTWHPDILHIHGYTTSLLFVIEWASAHRLPIAYEEHQTPDPQFDWWKGFENSINKADVVLAVSKKSAEALQTVCGVTQPIVMLGAIVTDPLDSGIQIAPGEEKEKPLQLTVVARLFVTKGLVYMLEAFKTICGKHPRVRLKVYGEGPLRAELMDYAAQLGLNGEEVFVGAFTSREELQTIMMETDIFVLPSILEGQPISLVEAMAFGRPIIATTVGGIPELIREGENGLLCEPGNSACLAEQVMKLIENPGLRARMGRAARLSYENGPFQPASVCAHAISVYQGILSARSAKQDVFIWHDDQK